MLQNVLPHSKVLQYVSPPTGVFPVFLLLPHFSPLFPTRIITELGVLRKGVIHQFSGKEVDNLWITGFEREDIGRDLLVHNDNDLRNIKQIVVSINTMK